jgi:hypothetical protein
MNYILKRFLDSGIIANRVDSALQKLLELYWIARLKSKMPDWLISCERQSTQLLIFLCTQGVYRDSTVGIRLNPVQFMICALSKEQSPKINKFSIHGIKAALHRRTKI